MSIEPIHHFRVKFSHLFLNRTFSCLKKKTTLIEYASFFGSIQIIQYLQYNNVSLTSSLWCYTIHSNSAELIYFLEENVNNQGMNYEQVFYESIKCHHNNIADYIKDNYLDLKQTDHCLYGVISSYNCHYFPTEVGYLISRSNKKDGFNISQFCFQLTQITIPTSVTSIRNFAFNGCSLVKKITIPTSVTSIGDFAFLDCSSLIQIEIPTSVTSIGKGAFYGCKSLTKITIPSSVKSINQFNFQNTDKDFYFDEITFIDELKSIKYINNSTVYISDFPVNDSVYPPSCLIDEDFLRNLFEGYRISSISINTTIRKDGTPHSFAYIKFETNEEAQRAISCFNYAKLDNVTFRMILINENDEYNLHHNIKEISLSIKNIDPVIVVIQLHNAFENFGEIISCKLPTYGSTNDTGYGFVCFRKREDAERALIYLKDASVNGHQVEVKPISNDIDLVYNEGLFEGCSSLTQISIPSTLTTIYDNEFKGCSSLTEISIPTSVTSIGDSSFYGCSSLTEISIPTSVTSIGKNAFCECSSLIQITIPSNIYREDLKLSSKTKVLTI